MSAEYTHDPPTDPDTEPPTDPECEPETPPVAAAAAVPLTPPLHEGVKNQQRPEAAQIALITQCYHCLQLRRRQSPKRCARADQLSRKAACHGSYLRAVLGPPGGDARDGRRALPSGRRAPPGPATDVGHAGGGEGESHVGPAMGRSPTEAAAQTVSEWHTRNERKRAHTPKNNQPEGYPEGRAAPV